VDSVLSRLREEPHQPERAALMEALVEAPCR
jgi:hypothetical protein